MRRFKGPSRFAARYPGKCHCGCGSRFSPGTEVVMGGSNANIQIASHTTTGTWAWSLLRIRTPIEEEINKAFHNRSSYTWGELWIWASNTKNHDLADLCRDLQEQ